MKHFEVHYMHGDTPSLAEFDADHYSVSQGNVAHFYRLPDRSNGAPPAKDELVGSVISPLTISGDGEALVIDAEVADLSDEILDRLAGHLGVEELKDEQKVRLVVSLISS